MEDDPGYRERRNMQHGDSYLRSKRKGHGAPDIDPNMQRLWDATRDRTQSIEDLCDKLNLSPKKLRALVESARAEGMDIRIELGRVGSELDRTADEQKIPGVSPVIDEQVTLGVLSDPHFGSKHCHVEALRDSVGLMYKAGARIIAIPGDMIDGCYDHSRFEWSHAGLEDQVDYALEQLPRHVGLNYVCITGNHDDTFWSKTGVNVGRYIESTAAAMGRKDLQFFGQRSAFVDLYGVRTHLWHPKGGGSYARSYKLQKKLESYSPGEKPKVLLMGHFHQFAYLHERGVHAIMCPTFQGGGSAFGKSLIGPPSIGGLILRWRRAENGTIRTFSVEKITYYEREPSHEIAEQMDGVELG
jgi:hypothetical protein